MRTKPKPQTSTKKQANTIDKAMNKQAKTIDKPGKNKPTNRQNNEKQAKTIDKKGK